MDSFIGRTSRFAFPSGIVPGFNPAHPAAQGIGIGGHGFSGIAYGGSFLNLIKPRPATITGATTSIKSIGPVANFTASSTNAYQFAGQSILNDTRATFGAIILPSSITVGAGGLLATGTGAGGYAFEMDNARLRTEILSGAFTSVASTIITMQINTPYFVVISVDWAVGAFFLATNLTSGQSVFQFVATSATTAAPNGTYAVGANQGAANSFGGAMAACMFSPQSISFGQILQWADDPWAFWYPQTNENENWAGGDILMPMICM